MGLLDLIYVKTNFPLWQKYFLDDQDQPSETVLQNEMDLADDELLGYIHMTSDVILNYKSLMLDLLSIVKYRGFNRLLGDVAFDTKPQIVRDYEMAIARLQTYKDGSAIPGGTNLDSAESSITMTAKPRRMDEWFNNGSEDNLFLK